MPLAQCRVRSGTFCSLCVWRLQRHLGFTVGCACSSHARSTYAHVACETCLFGLRLGAMCADTRVRPEVLAALDCTLAAFTAEMGAWCSRLQDAAHTLGDALQVADEWAEELAEAAAEREGGAEGTGDAHPCRSQCGF